VQLRRRYRPLPVRRVVDLLRISGLAVAVSLVTKFVEWIALVRGDRRSDWNPGAFAQVGALAALTLATGAAGVLLWVCRRQLTQTSQAGAEPDWLADTNEVAWRIGSAVWW
jgi:hypothetical protein